MKMNKSMLPSGTDDGLAEELLKVYSAHEEKPAYNVSEVEGTDGLVKRYSESNDNKMLRQDLMKACLKPWVEHAYKSHMTKSSINVASGFTPYDLRAPALRLVPWLSPIRESLPRVQHAQTGPTAYWKSIIANSSSYSRGGQLASPWVNEGQRAPSITLNTIQSSASYTTIGRDGTVTFESESSSVGFEDAIAAAHFFTLETLMVLEEDALLGGNKTLKLGKANTPTGTNTGSGSLTGTFYAAVVGLTYEGYRNYVLLNGFSAAGVPLTANGIHNIQQIVTTTGDGKVMTANVGAGQYSSISSANSPSSAVSATFSVVAKNGEMAWLWYLGTTAAAASLNLQALTTIPSYTITSATLTTTTETLSQLQNADLSVNDGVTGGGVGQVTAFDGIITQVYNNTSLSPQNAYNINLAGAILTTSGKGNVVEIDNMLIAMWNNYKVTVDVIYVNAQEMSNITSRVLNGSSAPLLRMVQNADGDEGFDVTASGVISFYHNPYIPGGRKIPIIIHPTLPPGTIVAHAKVLPSYFKSNKTPVVAEVITRRDYYSQEYAITTREYQHGVYCEPVLAIYAPFAFGIISSIGNG